MDTTLLNIRKLKYRVLDDLLGRQVMIGNLGIVEQAVLGTLVPSWATSFTLNTSQRDIAIGIAKWVALNLEFVTTRTELLSDSDAVTLNSLRELGLFNQEQEKAGLELGCKDPSGVQDIAERLTNGKVFFKVTLASKAPMDAIREWVSDVSEAVSKGTSSENALDIVLKRRLEDAATRFPGIFTVEEAFLANSDSIYLRKHFYG